MDFLGMADPGVVPTDVPTSLAFGIIRILALGAIGVVFAGILVTCLCNLFECRNLRRVEGRTETWPLMP